MDKEMFINFRAISPLLLISKVPFDKSKKIQLKDNKRKL